MKNKIAVFSQFQGIGQKILIGVANQFQQRSDWIMVPFPILPSSDVIDFCDDDYEGIIVIDPTESFSNSFGERSIPTINVFSNKEFGGATAISVDHEEIGQMAAQHLIGRGFKNIAFVGGIETEVAKRRYQSFKSNLNESDVSLHLFAESFPETSGSETEKGNANFVSRLSAWVEALPKPIGVFALDDWKAFTTQLACRKLGIRVPEDVALIGVNDDELACQISMPCLSSIRLPLEKMGYESVEAIISLIKNGKAESKVLKPVGLVTRESTNTFAVSDQVVEKALKFMQQESTKPIRVEEVLKHVGVSRSLLERRFRGEIGRTPLVEMRRQRVEKARALLADTELAINKISEMCGFASNIRFTTVFREQVGITPSEFRMQMQHSL